MSITIRTSKLAALLAVPLLVVALSACSSTSPEPNGGSDGSDSPSPAALSFSDWQLAQVECMRDQGVDMPDPSDNGSVAPVSGSTEDMDAIAAASQVCYEKLGDPPALSAEEKAESDAVLQKLLISIAECYRENGIDVPDPAPGEQLQAPDDLPEDVADECGGGVTAATPATAE